MKVYQRQLPVVKSYRLRYVSPPAPRPRPRMQTEAELANTIRESIEHVLLSGFWYCRSCESRCERIEDDHGQPAHCDRCGSHRILWNPPIDQALQKEVA